MNRVPGFAPGSYVSWNSPRSAGLKHQIAGDLGISQAAVSKILKRVELRILRELTDTVERQKARQSIRLEHLFAEAMRAWENSKADSTRRRQRKTQGGGGAAGATIAEVVVENQHGDPRYLDEARKTLGDHRKIWGLDAPQKVDVRASRNPYADMSESDLREELTRQARLLEAGGAKPPATSPAASTSPASTSTKQEAGHADRQ